MKTKFKIRLTDHTYPFVYKVCKGKVPISKMSGGKRGAFVYITLDARKCIEAAEMIDIETDLANQPMYGSIMFRNRNISFEVEYPTYEIPRHLNFSSFRTNSAKKQCGSKSRRPMHHWSKKQREYYLGVGKWP